MKQCIHRMFIVGCILTVTLPPVACDDDAKLKNGSKPVERVGSEHLAMIKSALANLKVNESQKSKIQVYMDKFLETCAPFEKLRGTNRQIEETKEQLMNNAMQFIVLGIELELTAEQKAQFKQTLAKAVAARREQGRVLGGWKELTPKEGGFSVLMPSTARYQTETTYDDEGVIVSHAFTVSEWDTEYVIQYTDTPTPVSKDIDLSALQQLLIYASKQGQFRNIENMQTISVDGFPGMAFTGEIRPENGSVYPTKMRMIFAGTRLYQQILWTSEKGGKFPEESSKFFDSFKLLGSPDKSGKAVTNGTNSKPTPSTSTSLDKKTVLLIVRLPANAVLEMEGIKTKGAGEVRRFRSPPLSIGKEYTYSLKATWDEDGKTRQVERSVKVQSGQEIEVDFQ